MAVSDEVTRALNGASRAVKDAVRDVLTEAGKVARTELNSTAKIVPGGDRTFSNFARAGSLRVKIRRFPDAILVIPVGPWGIAESGAAPHEMPAWGRGKAQHPGTRAKQGRRAWSQGRDSTFVKLGREIPQEIEERVQEGFERG